MQFYGDVSESDDPFGLISHGTALGGGLLLGRQFSPVLGVRGQFLTGKIKGKKYPPYNKFESTVFEFNAHGTVNFSNWFFKYKPDRLFSIYGFLGIGLATFNGAYWENGIKHPIHGSGPGESKIEGVIPIGTGLEIRLNDKLAVNLETSWHGVDNDKLDGVPGGSEYEYNGRL